MVLNAHRNHKAYYGRGEGGRGYGGEGRGRLYTYHYTVTTRMIPALRWAAMRSRKWWTKSQDSVHKPQPFRRERRAEAVSNRGPSAYQPNALPLGQTGSSKNRLLGFIEHFAKNQERHISYILTPSVPWYHLKTAIKVANLKPLSIFVFFFSHWHVKGFF